MNSHDLEKLLLTMPDLPIATHAKTTLTQVRPILGVMAH